MTLTGAIRAVRREARRPHRPRGPGRAQQRWAYALIAPGLVLVALFIVWPFVSGVVLSFQEWNGFTDPVWVGGANYEAMLSDPLLHKSAWNSVQYVVIATIGKNGVGLVLALLLYRVTRLRGFFRTAVFLPVTMSFVAVGLLWAWIYNPTFGLLNSGLEAIGLGGLAQLWLGDPSVALYSVIFVDIWKFAGFHALIYFAALQTVSAELVESALLDGAGYLLRLRHVIIPSIMPMIGVNLILGFTGSFLRNFDMVYVLTQGGPNHASEVLLTYMIAEAFSGGRMGYAAAIGYAMFAAVLVVVGISVLILRRRKVEV